MKVAVLLTGHTRSWNRCKDNFFKYIINPLNPDIFFHSWNENMNTQNNKNEYENADLSALHPIKYEIEDWNDIKDFLVKKSHFFVIKHPYDNVVNTLSQHRKWFLCNELKRNHEINNNFVYDIVIRTRPDVLYNDYLTNNLDFNRDIVYTPEEYSYNIISDVLSISSSKNTDIYCNIFNKEEEIYQNNIKSNRKEFNPHNVLLNYLLYVGLSFEQKN